MTFFFRKYKSLSRGYFGSWGHSLVAIAVVERFKPVSMYGPSARDQKKKKKMTVAERWPLVEVPIDSVPGDSD